MATHRIPIAILRPDSAVPVDLIANQITEATTPSVGDLLSFVLADGGADVGVYTKFTIPKNYVGSPFLIVRGLLDGAPGAADVLGFSFRKRAVADNESADGTFDAQEIASATIGSNGSSHSDEDELEEVISLTAGDYAIDDSVLGHLTIDVSATTYAGNLLLYAEDSLFFQYNDV